MRINAMFSRTVRKPHRKMRIETKAVSKIKIPKGLSWGNSFDYVKIREEVMKHKPEGKGWMLGEYTWASDN